MMKNEEKRGEIEAHTVVFCKWSCGKYAKLW